MAAALTYHLPIVGSSSRSRFTDPEVADGTDAWSDRTRNESTIGNADPEKAPDENVEDKTSVNSAPTTPHSWSLHAARSVFFCRERLA